MAVCGTLTTASPSRDSTASMTVVPLVSTMTHAILTPPKAGKFVLIVENASNTAPVFSVLSGTGLHASQGNLSLTIAASTAHYAIGPLSTSRFKSMSGTAPLINIQLPTACSTGSLWLVAVP